VHKTEQVSQRFKLLKIQHASFDGFAAHLLKPTVALSIDQRQHRTTEARKGGCKPRSPESQARGAAAPFRRFKVV
jgi:hypothetical protein